MNCDFKAKAVCKALFRRALILCLASNTPNLVLPQSASGQVIAGPALSGPQLVAPPLQPLTPKPTDASASQVPNLTPAIDPAEVLPEHASQAMSEFLASIIRDNIPESHLEDKDWDRTKKVYAGIKIRREGLKLETERRWKTVNHGLWKKYEAKLVDPKNRLDVRMTDVQWQPDGRLHARLNMVSEMIVNAWQTQWNYGVRVYAVQSEARVRLQMDVEVTVGFALDNASFPPALVVDPRVENASLRMASFHVNRIGNLGGDVAEELGDAAEGMIRKLVVEPQSDKLAGKLNRQIEKKRDKLRIEAGDWLGRWFNQ